MKPKITQSIAVGLTLVGWIFGVSACTTAEKVAQVEPTLTVPDYVGSPHPEGYDLADLRAIFLKPQAPKPEEVASCDAAVVKLRSLTQSDDEVGNGTRTLVKNEPVKYHWCFYWKILQLEEGLKASVFLDEKQKAVLDAYAFLTPVSRAYLSEFRDSRYLRWAVKHYRNLSALLFYRRLELTPQTTVELVEASNPFTLLRSLEAPKPVLEKYGIASEAPVTEVEAVPVVETVPVVERAPASASVPVPAPVAVPVTAPAPVAASAVENEWPDALIAPEKK
jgi:hypothetical protein